MKTHRRLIIRNVAILIALFLIQLNCFSDVIKTVGASGADYSTLKLAFDDINAGTINTGVITLQIIDNTTETSTAVLNASGSGNCSYTSVLIYPTVSGKAVTGALNAPLIDLNGADNVTIDGRVGSTGTLKNLTIVNTSTYFAGKTSTIRFINDATLNTIKYCTLKGSSTDPTAGIIFLSTTTGTTGNDGNTINNNDITCAEDVNRPINVIYSYGTSSTTRNSGNTYSNNNIYNFLNRSAASTGINIDENSTDQTITGNSFYETTTFAPTASVSYSIILISTVMAGGYVISDNYIGGNAPLCSGTFSKTTGTSPFYNNTFFAINLNVGTTTATSVQNNTIKNINWSNSGAAFWTGIQVTVGSVNIGTITGNVIGAASGQGSITVTGGATDAVVHGIYFLGNGTINCQNNTIASITSINSDASAATNFYGIRRGNTSTSNVSNNTIGSSVQENSIQAISASSSNAQYVYGIYNSTGGTLTASNNIIDNLTNGSTNTNEGTTGLVNGITSSYGINVLTSNTIRNLAIANANNTSTHLAAVGGIVLTSTNALNTITGNSIYNLSNSFNGFAGSVVGLYFGSTGMYTSVSHSVTGNFIRGLTVTGSSVTGSSIYGIKVNTGQTTYANNIISLNTNADAALYGFYETGTSSNNNSLYFNTISLSGTTSGATNSYALYSAGSANTRNIRNNIFQNIRSNATGKHYAAYFNYNVNTLLTLDYNNYYVNGTGGVLGYYGGSDVTSLPIVTNKDINSLNINPLLANAVGANAINYKPNSDNLEGTTITPFTTDYASTSRSATPTIGAYETNLSLNIDVYKSGIYQSTYSTLKLAFDKINNGTHTGNIELKIKANTTETSSAILYQSGYTGAGGVSNYSSVSIYPIASNISITGNFDAPLITLNGADNVTIDGRENTSGSSKSLTLTNSNTSSGAVVVRYINTAETNIIKYCALKASPNNNGTGIIYFTGAASVNGNNNNIIEYCDITCNSSGRPVNAVFSSGTSGLENKFNIIRYNNIYNAFSPTANSYNINISNSSSDWTISNNSFYETTTFAPAGAYKYYPIFMNTGNNHSVKNNYIGGSLPECGGGPLTINASLTHYYAGIFINGGSINKSIVENNIIRNINYTSTNSNPWDGIYINSGNVDVIGNTIGAETGTGSITINTPVASATATISGGVVTSINLVGGGSGYTTAPLITFSTAGSTVPATATAFITNGEVTSITLNTGGSGYTGAPGVIFDASTYSTSHGMIQNSPGTVNIINNKTGSITTVGSATYSHGFESIYIRSLTASSVTTIKNNLYGSLSTANSIYVSSSAVNSPQKQDVYGIYSSSSGTTIISGNTIANLTNGDLGTNSGSKTRGIQTIAGTNNIYDNVVRNLSASSGNSGKRTSASVIGISQTSTSGSYQTVKGNQVYQLSNTNPTQRNNVIGIYFSGITNGTNNVTENFIHSISSSTSDILSEINGIVLFNGQTTTSNNIINLGNNITHGYLIHGIWDEGGATNNNSIYYNSVYIGGVVSGTTSNTSALWNNYNTSTRNYRNNIFYNARTGGSTGKHFAIVIAGVANTTIDYNDYYNAGLVLGKIGSLEKTDLTAWKAGTSQDLNSINTNPGFTIPGGTSSLDYYTNATLQGTSIPTVPTDYDGLTRGITPRMGALEFNDYTWTGTTDTDFATATNWAGGEVPPNGATISFSATPTNHCVLDQNRSLKTIINAQDSKYFKINGKQLTITGDLTFSNNAKIDATTALSSVVFAGTTTQIIPNGVFLNNIVEILTINNEAGVNLNTDLTIEKGIALHSGNFDFGANTLTFNGVVTEMTGTVSGGSSTNMIIGENNAIINMPELTLNNLTINRASGVSMYGNLSLTGTLTLINGALSVGSNTLTLSKTPVRTNGNIVASDSGSNLIFTNTSALTLPESIFSTHVNDFTISGVGGVTSAGDFTINGIINLSAANPTFTRGLLNMWDGSSEKTLTMGANATTIGNADVTGIIKRTSFEPNTVYTFGSQFTTVTFPETGTLPAEWSFKTTIGAAPGWKTSAVNRFYDIIRTGGSGSYPTVKFHYLDEELNVNTESNLVFFGNIAGTGTTNEYGKVNANTTENWVSLSGTIEFAPTAFGQRFWTLASKETESFTWQGTVPGNETDWNENMNWAGGIVPLLTSDVIIPANCQHYPTLTSDASINTINIESGATLNASTFELTINGGNAAWYNNGTFNPGTGKVVFTNPHATMSGITEFNNLTVSDDAGIVLTTGNYLKISGNFINEGELNATEFPNTVEYSGGNQSVILPNGSTIGYYNLMLTGTGEKSLPSLAMNVYANIEIGGTTTVYANGAITMNGNFILGVDATFVTGAYHHVLNADIQNNGTFSASENNTISLLGSSNQHITGAEKISFYNLILNNLAGVSLQSNVAIDNLLTLTNGNLMVGSETLEINNLIEKTNGFLEVSASSSLTFGGTSTLTLPDNLFNTVPGINNLTINRSGGLLLSNQNMTVDGLLNLVNGTLSLNTNTLTLAGVSPIRTTGNIDASNAADSLIFTNGTEIELPSSLFATNVSTLVISGLGGITSKGDFTISGELYLSSENPSSSRGALNMMDGTTTKTLTMTEAAITRGVGDVTGIVRRSSFEANKQYSFGNQFTTISFLSGGTYPTEINAKIRIGSAPTWKTTAVERVYDFIQTGGSGCYATVAAHYLDAELNGNTENNLMHWTYGTDGQLPAGSYEWGRSNSNQIDNWIEIANVNIAFFPTSFGKLENALDLTSNNVYTWNGSQSTLWTNVENWTPNGSPSETSNIIIPDASTTLYSPVLPASASINTMYIETGGVLSALENSTLTINGANNAWCCTGTFNAETSNVIFNNEAATICGTTSFYNITINTGKALFMTIDSHIKIAGAVTNNGSWHAEIGSETIVEYNGGNQTVLFPNSTTKRYHNLVLGGSGIKTLPASKITIYGDLTLSGTASTTLNDTLQVLGNVNIGSGTQMIIAPQKMLVVNNKISNNAGAAGIIIKASASEPNGTVIFHNANNEPVQATVEMYSKASKPTTTYKWQYFGIPLRSMVLSPTFTGGYVRRLNETGSGGGGLEPTRHWVQLTSSSPLTSFTGYEVTQLNPTTYTFTGELENGDYDSDQLSYTSGAEYPGQHLIANSYSAAIDISKIEFGSTDESIIENTVYLYNTGSKDDWLASGPISLTESNVAGQYISIPKNIANRGLGIPGQIPSMQAFLVRAKSSNANAWVKIPYSATGTMVKNTTQQRAPSNHVATRIEIKGTRYSDFVWLFTEPSCTSDFENGWDGYKNSGSTNAPQLFAVENAGRFQVDSKNDIDETSLAYTIAQDEICTLIFTHQNLQSRYENLYLYDMEENEYVDISKNETQYSFFAPKATTAVNRFKIVTAPGMTTNNITYGSNDIQVFSNQNTVYVRNATNEIANLSLYDLAGRVIMQKQMEPKSTTTTNVPFETGLYVAKVVGKTTTVNITKTIKIEGHEKY